MKKVIPATVVFVLLCCLQLRGGVLIKQKISFLQGGSYGWGISIYSRYYFSIFRTWFLRKNAYPEML